MSVSLAMQMLFMDSVKPLLKYTPVLRLRTQEQVVLTTFDFGHQIYPLVEIIKGLDRKQATHRKGKKLVHKTIKTFESAYIKVISKVRSDKLFVDLPVHMKAQKGIDKGVLEFLQTVVFNRKARTEHIIRLKTSANKIIPVISTYSRRTGEPNTILLQEADLREHFPSIAFRTFPDTFHNDISQIALKVQPNDYLILDLDGYSADPKDEDFETIIKKLETWTHCHTIILRPAMGEGITNAGLVHGEIVKEADNTLLNTFEEFHGNSFADYAGIKKAPVNAVGSVSPGFIYYNAFDNHYYGYKGNYQPTDNLKLDEYGNTIVPAVISSKSSRIMTTCGIGYLSPLNLGWQAILDIQKYPTKGRFPALFKRISIYHYLHCMKIKIANGNFNKKN